MSSSWKSTPTSCATSAATRSIPRRWKSSANSGCSKTFSKRPHQELRELAGVIGGVDVKLADFSHVPAHCRFIALMPQWDFLDFLADHARRYPNFRLIMEAEATGLIEDGGRIAGVVADTPQGRLELTRRSRRWLRRPPLPGARAGGAPADRIRRADRRALDAASKSPADSPTTLGRIAAGVIFVTLDRGDYWQCALVIAKGGADTLRAARASKSFRQSILKVAPSFADRVGELQDWDQIKLLTVKVNRLREWCRPGLLCIGDAAHAMSPIGGIGINLAIQDAVATANILAPVFARGAPFARRSQARAAAARISHEDDAKAPDGCPGQRHDAHACAQGKSETAARR